MVAFDQQIELSAWQVVLNYRGFVIFSGDTGTYWPRSTTRVHKSKDAIAFVEQGWNTEVARVVVCLMAVNRKHAEDRARVVYNHLLSRGLWKPLNQSIQRLVDGSCLATSNEESYRGPEAYCLRWLKQKELEYAKQRTK